MSTRQVERSRPTNGRRRRCSHHIDRARSPLFRFDRLEWLMLRLKHFTLSSRRNKSARKRYVHGSNGSDRDRSQGPCLKQPVAARRSHLRTPHGLLTLTGDRGTSQPSSARHNGQQAHDAAWPFKLRQKKMLSNQRSKVKDDIAAREQSGVVGETPEVPPAPDIAQCARARKEASLRWGRRADALHRSFHN